MRENGAGNIYHKDKLVEYIEVKLIWSDKYGEWIDLGNNDTCYNEIIQQGYYYVKGTSVYERHSTNHLIKLDGWWWPRNEQSTCYTYLLADHIGNIYITEYVYGYTNVLRSCAETNLKNVLSREHKAMCINVILYAELLGLGDVTLLIKQFAVQLGVVCDEKQMSQRLACINWHGQQ
jgi:hypothetical protein